MILNKIFFEKNNIPPCENELCTNKSSQPKFHLTYNVRENYSFLTVENHTVSSIFIMVNCLY